MPSSRLKSFRRRLKRRSSKGWKGFYGFVENIVLTPGDWLKASWKFVTKQLGRWRKSQNFRSFLMGLPSAVVMLVVGYVSIVTWYKPTAVLADTYNRRAQQALASNDLRYAKLCLERLIQIRGEDPQTLMQLAEIYSTEDNPRRVAALMQRIAPSDRTTIPEAHIWQARNLLAKQNLTLDELKEVEKQLQNALKVRPSDPIARSLLGQVYAQTGRDSLALEMYQGIRQRTAGDNLRMAESASRIPNVMMARLAAEEALSQFEQQLKQEPESWVARENLVKCYVFLEEFQEALKVLQQSPPSVDREQLRQSLARVYGTWTQVLQLKKGEVPLRIDVIERTLKLDPNSVAALNSIADLLSVADEAELTKIRAILKRMLALGMSTPVVHLCIGTDAILRDNLEVAMKHLQLAYQADPNLIAAANNLAWAMSQADPPKLNEALSLVNSVVEKQPELGAVRDTRGQILLKMERFNDAIIDLEFALRQLPDSRVTREALVKAYRAAGMEEVAKEQELVLEKTK